MKSKYLLMTLTIVALGLTSCNSGIKRIVYKESTFKEASEIHNKIIANQKNKEGISTLFDNGSINYKYKLTIKGTPRVEDISFHNVDLNLSAGCNLYWAMDKNYLKVEGEQEEDYFIKDGEQYWHLESFIIDGKNKKERTNVTDKVAAYDSFKDYLVERINFYTTLSIPFLFNHTVGITGESCYISPIFETWFNLRPNVYFDEEINSKLSAISNKYKEAKGSNYLNLIYGVDNDTSVCFTMKGKGNVSDFTDTKYEHGTLEIDNFMSWKDNYISQYEMKFNANGINVKKINANMKFNLYVSSETNKNTCKVDTINLTDYEIK